MRERRNLLAFAALGLVLVVAAFAVGRATRSESQDVASPAPEVSGEQVDVSIPGLVKGSLPGMREEPKAATTTGTGGGTGGDTGGTDATGTGDTGGTETQTGTGTGAGTGTTTGTTDTGGTGFDEVPGGTE